MKKYIYFIIVLLIATALFTNCNQKRSQKGVEIEYSTLSGPYLGQKPPGMIPEIFAPGIISTGYEEFKIVFSPDGKELFYQLWGAPFGVILHSEEINGRWTEPVIPHFSGQVLEGYDISPDGKKLFICSNRNLSGIGIPQDEWYIWITEKSMNTWGELKVLKPSIQGYPTVAANGNLYLAHEGKIWLSEYVNGEYSKMIKMGDNINSEEFSEQDPFIAPDESYLMFCRRDDGFGSWDIFISFRLEDGSWTKAKNMGEPINSKYSDVYPFVTSDGKYFFFSSRRTFYKDYSEEAINYEKKMEILNSSGNGSQDIYWVDAKVIENLRQIK